MSPLSKLKNCWKAFKQRLASGICSVCAGYYCHHWDWDCHYSPAEEERAFLGCLSSSQATGVDWWSLLVNLQCPQKQREAFLTEWSVIELVVRPGQHRGTRGASHCCGHWWESSLSTEGVKWQRLPRAVVFFFFFLKHCTTYGGICSISLQSIFKELSGDLGKSGFIHCVKREAPVTQW